MKKTGSKFLALLLCLLMVVSLMSGALSVAAEDEGFTAATELSANRTYLIVTEADGKYYAMTNEGSYATGAEEITVADGTATGCSEAAVWIPQEDGTLKSAVEEAYVFAGSGGFMTYSDGRAFIYDAETETVKLHTKYVLTFADGKFDQTEDASAACKVLLFAGEAIEVPVEDPDNWEGKIDPATVPETDNVSTIYREAVKNADGSITLAFTSDVHYDGEHNNLAAWLPIAEEKYGYIDAMGFCGDMGSAYISGEAYWDVTGAVMDYVDGEIADGKIGAAAYTYGNHEWFVGAGGEYMTYYEKPAAQRLLRNGPAIVTDDYIIYAFGASPDAGFDWNTYGYNTKHMYTMWQEDLDALAAYLASAPADIPIFITTHYPLHIWTDRQVALGGDIVDVLNKYPNVVLLWGHNHSDKDLNYYDVKHAGDVIECYPEGNYKALNFDYLAAGTTADKEYTGPDAGSAWTLNKGLIVTIAADGTLTYDYITLDGQIIREDGMALVEFRDGVNYEVYASEYVPFGGAATAPEVKEFEGYSFIGWNVDFSNVDRSMLVTAEYEKLKKPIQESDELDPAFVYLTLNEEYGTAVSKDGEPVVMYAVPYTEGMTVGDAFIKLHEMAYAEGTDGVEVGLMEGGAPFELMLKAWGYTPGHGSMFYTAEGYIAGETAAEPGACYYAIAYTSSPYQPGLLLPGRTSCDADETITMMAQYLKFNSSTYGYDPAGFSGDVYAGTDWNDLQDTGIDADDGYFDISFAEPGVYYVVVKNASAGESVGIVTVSAPEAPAVTETPDVIEAPAEDVIPMSPQTGDSFPMLYVAAALFFGAAAVVVLKAGKKKA